MSQLGTFLRLVGMVLRLSRIALRLVGRVLKLINMALSLIGRFLRLAVRTVRRPEMDWKGSELDWNEPKTGC